MPVRDDWVSAAELVRRIDGAASAFPATLDILLIDDASVRPALASDFLSEFKYVRSIRVLRLLRNLGHQRAIAIGLVYLQRNFVCNAVLVMDADGEDTAEGAWHLIQAFDETNPAGGPAEAIFAERSRRTESTSFKLFYQMYKAVHRISTGRGVRVGNFSILPAAFLKTLVVMSELWNHYAAAFFRSGLPFRTVPIPRGYRIEGKSRMNFVSLAAHGMSAISVFGDVVAVRLLIASMAGALLAALGIIAVFLTYLFSDRAIPGWATYATGVLAIILIQFITIAISFTFTMLSGRVNLSFVPLRDHELFIDGVDEMYSKPCLEWPRTGLLA